MDGDIFQRTPAVDVNMKYIVTKYWVTDLIIVLYRYLLSTR